MRLHGPVMGASIGGQFIGGALHRFAQPAMRAGITGMIAILLVRRRAFSPAVQLLLRPGPESAPVAGR